MKVKNQFRKVTEGKRIGRTAWVTVWFTDSGSHVCIGAPTKAALVKAWDELKLPIEINMAHVAKARFFKDKQP